MNTKWADARNAEKCCNGYMRLHVPFSLRHYKYNEGQCQKEVETMALDSRRKNMGDEFGYFLRWIPENEVGWIRYLRSIMPLEYLAELEGMSRADIV